MDGPPIPVTNPTSTSSKRLPHSDQPAWDIRRSPREMLRPGSTTDKPVGGRTPVPRHDGQRPADAIAERLEDPDELGVWADEFPGTSVDKLAPREVSA